MAARLPPGPDRLPTPPTPTPAQQEPSAFLGSRASADAAAQRPDCAPLSTAGGGTDALGPASGAPGSVPTTSPPPPPRARQPGRATRNAPPRPRARWSARLPALPRQPFLRVRPALPGAQPVPTRQQQAVSVTRVPAAGPRGRPSAPRPSPATSRRKEAGALRPRVPGPDTRGSARADPRPPESGRSGSPRAPPAGRAGLRHGPAHPHEGARLAHRGSAPGSRQAAAPGTGRPPGSAAARRARARPRPPPQPRPPPRPRG